MCFSLYARIYIYFIFVYDYLTFVYPHYIYETLFGIISECSISLAMSEGSRPNANYTSEASRMLEAALEQMDGIIQGAKYELPTYFDNFSIQVEWRIIHACLNCFNKSSSCCRNLLLRIPPWKLPTILMRLLKT